MTTTANNPKQEPTNHKKTGFSSTFTGLIRSVRSVDKANRDKSRTWVENLVDCEYIAQDGSIVIIEFRLGKRAVDEGLVSKLKPFVGKHCTFAVSSNSRVWNDRIYTDNYYAGTDLPVEL